MSIHAIICTRSADQVTATTNKLLNFLSGCGVNVILMSKAKSIFKAYKGAFERINPDDNDICIFCHDDIEIREVCAEFLKKLQDLCYLPETGFVGPAGTTYLSPNAVWWDQDVWKAGLHRGKVSHIDHQGEEYLTEYGPADDVVALDGLFLAARAKVVRDIGLDKPEYFEGEWDFYDIHYTTTAFEKGYTNKVIDMNILHISRGELVGRESWHKNRLAFIQNTELPIRIQH
jgi:hypothetical protein